MSSALTRVLLLSSLLTVAGSSAVPARTPANTSADARLQTLYTEEWEWRQKELGRGAADRFARVDAASQQSRLAYWTKTLAALDAIPFEQLSAEEKVNAQIFRTSLRELVSDVQYRTYEAPFNSDTFFWTSFTPRQGFANAAAYRSYLARLRDVPRYFDEQIANMRAGLARGYSVPRVSVIGRDQTIEPVRQGRRQQSALRPVRPDAGRHSGGRAGRASRRSEHGDSRHRRSGLRQPADDDAAGVPGEGAPDAGGFGDA